MAKKYKNIFVNSQLFLTQHLQVRSIAVDKDNVSKPKFVNSNSMTNYYAVSNKKPYKNGYSTYEQ